MFQLAIAGFFRSNELCNIAPNHIEIHSQNIKISVHRSKTGVYKEGNYVYIMYREVDTALLMFSESI